MLYTDWVHSRLSNEKVKHNRNLLMTKPKNYVTNHNVISSHNCSFPPNNPNSIDMMKYYNALQ